MMNDFQFYSFALFIILMTIPVNWYLYLVEQWYQYKIPNQK